MNKTINKARRPVTKNTRILVVIGPRDGAGGAVVNITTVQRGQLFHIGEDDAYALYNPHTGRVLSSSDPDAAHDDAA